MYLVHYHVTLHEGLITVFSLCLHFLCLLRFKSLSLFSLYSWESFSLSCFLVNKRLQAIRKLLITLLNKRISENKSCYQTLVKLPNSREILFRGVRICRECYKMLSYERVALIIFLKDRKLKSIRYNNIKVKCAIQLHLKAEPGYISRGSIKVKCLIQLHIINLALY